MEVIARPGRMIDLMLLRGNRFIKSKLMKIAGEPALRPAVRSAISRRCRSGGARAAKATGVVGHDYSEMGADLLSGVDRCRYPRFHRRIRRLGRCRPLPVLCFRGDLPGAADPGADDLQGIAENRPSVIARSAATKQSSLPGSMGSFAEPVIRRAFARPVGWQRRLRHL